jgi:hypothetical protein
MFCTGRSKPDGEGVSRRRLRKLRAEETIGVSNQ